MPAKPSNQEFKKIFDRIAPRYSRILNRYAVSRRIEFITKYAQGKCLEAGAGSGEITKALLNNHEVIATDISPQMIQAVKNKSGIKAYVADAEKLPFKNNSFDTVIAAELIYYLDRPERFLQEARRVLQPNGRLIITSATKITELYDKVRAGLRKLGFRSMYFDDQNRRFMSAGRLQKLLQQNGFQVKHVEKTVIFPWTIFNSLNRFLEKTPLNCLSSFIFICAEKIN